MISKCLCIALFAILQISTVLCRTTGTPEGHLKENEFVPTSESVMIGKERLRVYAPESFHEGTDIPGKLSNDYIIDNRGRIQVSYRNAVLNSSAIAGIIVGVIGFVSLILGLIMYLCCKKEPRRGFIVNANAGGRVAQTQLSGNIIGAIGAQGTVQPVQHYPPENIYPPAYPTQ